MPGSGVDYSDKSLAGLVCLFATLAVVLPPWVFGCIHPGFHFALILAIAASAACWLPLVVSNATERRISFFFLAPLLLVAGLCVLQLVPLPSPLLSLLSPKTAELYAQLLPATREVSVGGQLIAQNPFAASQRLSLYPAETWKQTTAFLSVLLLFAITQTTFSSKTIRRLLLALSLNGALLAFAAIASYLESEGEPSIVWKYEIGGQTFGSFLNRNHLAFYLNLCIGAAIGSWLGRFRTISSSTTRWTHDWQLLLIATSLVLMLSAVIVSQSRGGICSTLVAITIMTGLYHSAATMRRSLVALGLLVAVACFVFWVDTGLADSRVTAFLLGSDVIDVRRTDLWQRLSGLIVKFPLFGSGLGTIPFVEPLTRTFHDARVVKYAHNDFLQILIELGFVGASGMGLFLIRLGKCAATFRARPITSNELSNSYGIGILFAIIAASVHSMVDFSLRMPGITAAMAVLVGCFVAINHRNTPPSTSRTSHCGIGQRVAVALAVILILCVACGQFSSLHAAATLIAKYDELDKHDPQRTPTLELAVETYPSEIVWRLLLAEQYAVSTDLTVEDLRAAQHHIVAARDMCPIFAYAHADLALAAATFNVSDSAENYFRRAQLVAPTSAKLLFSWGQFEFEHNNPQMAVKCWRAALNLDATQVREVLTLVAQNPTFDESDIVAVIPDNADILYQASKLSGQAEKTSRLASDSIHKAWLVRSLRVMDALPQTTDNGRSFYRRAIINEELGNQEQATSDYQTAVTLCPNEPAWRLKFAKCLVATERLSDARVQLRQLVRRTSNREAGELLKQIAHIEEESNALAL